MKNLHENALMQELSKEAKSATNGGYAPPTKEQMEEADSKFDAYFYQ
mgnify:CR=1 FL=1